VGYFSLLGGLLLFSLSLQRSIRHFPQSQGAEPSTSSSRRRLPTMSNSSPESRMGSRLEEIPRSRTVVSCHASSSVPSTPLIPLSLDRMGQGRKRERYHTLVHSILEIEVQEVLLQLHIPFNRPWLCLISKSHSLLHCITVFFMWLSFVDVQDLALMAIAVPAAVITAPAISSPAAGRTRVAPSDWRIENMPPVNAP